jgi:hypothetical protein
VRIEKNWRSCGKVSDNSLQTLRVPIAAALMRRDATDAAEEDEEDGAPEHSRSSPSLSVGTSEGEAISSGIKPRVDDKDDSAMCRDRRSL